MKWIMQKHQRYPTGEQIKVLWQVLVETNVSKANLDSLREIWH
jgi:hypothetical protein